MAVTLFRRSIVAVLVVLAGCGSPTEIGVYTGMRITSAGVLQSGPVRDSVVFQMTTTNVANRHVVMNVGFDGPLDLEVKDGQGEPVWRLRGGARTLVGYELVIGPGQSDVWTATWRLEDQERNPVPTGAYWLTGLFGDDIWVPIIQSRPVRVDVER